MKYVFILFLISSFGIFWAMIGYPLLLNIINFFYRKINYKTKKWEPHVTLLIVAHNEEKVIKNKLNNAISLDYPKDKFEILVSSDNSSDDTNKIVEEFIRENQNFNIRLYKVKDRKGKTNAQNEAQKTIASEIIVFTDANSIFDKKAIKELVSYFSDDSIAYVTGKLVYVNDFNNTAASESTYWESDLKLRSIESKIKTITAGNGAIYACRNTDYFDAKLIESHDSAMPLKYALDKKRAIYNENAIAYEKAGENIRDEFKRKVRMNRGIIKGILPSLRVLNIFKYGWFTVFYLGHRSFRYLLWFNHLVVFVSNVLLFNQHYIFIAILIGQVLFYLIALMVHITKIKNKYLNMIYYYTMTIIAQWFGVFNIITGKAKPFWEKAESTR